MAGMIQFSSDNNITGNEDLYAQFREKVENGLRRFGDRVSRVMVHLGDENSKKTGDNDKRCMMEARLDGMEPIAVTAYADNLGQAVHDALGKLKAALGSVVDKQKTQNKANGDLTQAD